jgi:hypothetical protein
LRQSQLPHDLSTSWFPFFNRGETEKQRDGEAKKDNDQEEIGLQQSFPLISAPLLLCASALKWLISRIGPENAMSFAGCILAICDN